MHSLRCSAVSAVDVNVYACTGAGYDDARRERGAGRRAPHDRRAPRRRRAHARRAVAGRAAGARRRARVVRARDRSVRRRLGPGIVHRSANRHRDDPGARPDHRAAHRGGVGARGAGADGGRRRPRAGRDLRRRVDGRPPARRVRRAVSRRRRAALFARAPRGNRRADGRRSGRHAGAVGRPIRDAAVVFVGDGAALYADTIAEHATARVEGLSHQPLLAGTIGRMAVARAQRGETIDPAAVRPLYVRRPDAEVERETGELSTHDGHRGHQGDTQEWCWLPLCPWCPSC